MLHVGGGGGRGGGSMQYTKGQESEEMQHYEAGPPRLQNTIATKPF